MKKKILAFVMTLALLLAYAAPVYATVYSYGLYTGGDTEIAQSAEQIADGIKEYYDIEAFYVVDTERDDQGGAEDFASYALGNLGAGDNAIIYAKTSNEYFIGTTGNASSYFTDEDFSNIYQAVSEYENAELYDMAAVTFLSNVNIILSGSVMPDGYEAYEVSDDELENQQIEDTAEGEILVDASASRYVVDDANLLSESEKNKLENRLFEISEKHQFDVVLVTTDSLGGKTPEAYADDYYDYNGYGRGENKDGCLLLVSMENRDCYISTTGYGITALTDAGIQYIIGQITPLMSDGKWTEAFDKYGDLVDDFVAQAKNGEPYDIGNLPKAKKSAGQIIKGIVISLIIGLIIGFIIMKSVKSSYTKAVHQNADATDYLVGGSLQLTGAYENFMYNNVTQTRIESNSSGGGSSTHTGSSGTTHGGGGGKF